MVRLSPAPFARIADGRRPSARWTSRKRWHTCDWSLERHCALPSLYQAGAGFCANTRPSGDKHDPAPGREPLSNPTPRGGLIAPSPSGSQPAAGRVDRLCPLQSARHCRGILRLVTSASCRRKRPRRRADHFCSPTTEHTTLSVGLSAPRQGLPPNSAVISRPNYLKIVAPLQPGTTFAQSPLGPHAVAAFIPNDGNGSMNEGHKMAALRQIASFGKGYSLRPAKIHSPPLVDLGQSSPAAISRRTPRLNAKAQELKSVRRVRLAQLF